MAGILPKCLLDIGCAAGSSIKAMNSIWPRAHYTGIDVSEELIRIAEENLKDVNAELVVADAVEYKPREQFDIIIASGILSCFEDFAGVLERWLSWLEVTGKLLRFR